MDDTSFVVVESIAFLLSKACFKEESNTQVKSLCSATQDSRNLFDLERREVVLVITTQTTLSMRYGQDEKHVHGQDYEQTYSEGYKPI